MPVCKFNVPQGRAGRYVRKCDIETNRAIVFTTQLDDGFTVTTQLPLCETHYKEKTDMLHALGISWQLHTL